MSLGVDATRAKRLVLGLTEVVADRADDMDGVEEGGGEGEVDSGCRRACARDCRTAW